MWETTAAWIEARAKEERHGRPALTEELSRRTDAVPASVAAVARSWRPFERQTDDVVCAELTLGSLPPRVALGGRAMLPIASCWGQRADGGPLLALCGAWRHQLAAEESRKHGFLEPRWSTRVLLIGPGILDVADPSATRPADRFVRMSCAVVDDAGHSADFHSLFESLRPGMTSEARIEDRVRAISRLIQRHAELARTADVRAESCATTVERVRRFVTARVTEAFELDDLAALTRVSKFHLLRLFEREMGMTPRTFQAQMRLACALAMIAVGVPVSRTTFDTGFADQSHLTRRFKETLGLTPGALQRLLFNTSSGTMPSISSERAATTADTARSREGGRAAADGTSTHQSREDRVA
jgi:AraC-like DNA-binding protein